MGVDVSIILPCRNEEKTIGVCIAQIEDVIRRENISAEIIVSDSSTDNSASIAKQYKVMLVKHDKKGYGVACMEAFSRAKGKYLIMADSDGTYDFREIPRFIEKLEEGSDLVIGSRINGTIEKGAMPFMHRYFGNPLLSKTMNLFFHTNVSDAHSGFRAITKEAFDKLNLKTTGMEFASEMIIKAAKNHLKISEVPITYSVRIGKSHLKSFSDGWRHLRFMLMFSPTYLFFIPGFFLLSLGFADLIMMLLGTFIIGGKDFGIYFTLFGSLFSILGYQLINLGLYSRIYAIHTGFEKDDRLIGFIADKMPLERGILLSGIGILASLYALISFVARIFRFDLQVSYSWVFFSLTIFIIAAQTLFSVFFISIMLIEKTN